MVSMRKQLDRILRVRTLQLGLVRADEAARTTSFASEAALRSRIAQLADNIAPAPTKRTASQLGRRRAFSRSASRIGRTPPKRGSQCRQRVERAAHATREAKRDQSAIEKLIARAEAEAALKALRAMEAAPPFRKIRHDPC